MASAPGPVARLLGEVAVAAIRLRPFLPTYFHLLISAVFPIYTGAHASLSRPSSAAKPEKKKRDSKKDDEAEDEEDDVVVQKMEGLSPSDAIVFPLMAGATLASLYFIIKWLKDPALLNRILRWYFSQMGVFFSIRFLKGALTVVRSFVFPDQYTYRGTTWKVNARRRHFEKSGTTATGSPAPNEIKCSPIPGLLSRIHFSKPTQSLLWFIRDCLYTKATLRFHIKSLFTLKTPVDTLDVASTIISVGLSIYSLVAPSPWYLTNFFGFAFCYGSLQFMSPTTFWTGSLILSSLFIYDIYFVFFTPLMVTVATKLDVPIKLLFPRPPAPDAPADTLSLAMLGLGDIVIPGMVMGLALRFDLYQHYARKQRFQSIIDSKDSQKSVQKATYTQATGRWGERFWTQDRLLPEKAMTSSTGKQDPVTATKFPKPYFTASVVGYLLGMITTLGAMQIAEHPQPALLYLVPGVLGSLWGTAFFRGDIKEMWNFTEEEDDDEEADGKGKDEDEGVLDTLRSFLGFRPKKPQPTKGKKGEEGRDGVEEKGQAENSKGSEQEDKGKNENSKPKDESRQLIGFSIDLPRKKEKSQSETQDKADGPTDSVLAEEKVVDEPAVVPSATSTSIETSNTTEGGRANKRTRVA